MSFERKQLQRMKTELEHLKGGIIECRLLMNREYVRKAKEVPPEIYARLHKLQDRAKWLDKEIMRFEERMKDERV